MTITSSSNKPRTPNVARSTASLPSSALERIDTPEKKAEADAKLLESLNRPLYEKGHAERYASGPTGPAALVFRASTHLQALNAGKKGKDTEAVKGALQTAHTQLQALAKKQAPETLDGALAQAQESQAILEKALAGMGKTKEGSAKALEHMLDGVKHTVTRLEDQKVHPLNHLDGTSALIANAHRKHEAKASYDFMVHGTVTGKDAQAYANRTQNANALWGHSSVKRKDDQRGMDFIRDLSRKNIQNLETEIQARGGMTAQDKEILRAFLSSDYVLSHSTTQEGKEAIEGSGKMLSKIQLEHLAAGSGTPVHNNTPKTDEQLLRNNDFVFFRFEAGKASDAKSRYGTNTFRYEAKQTPLFQTGWITIEDQLTPKVIEPLKRKDDTVLRAATQMPDPENKVFAANLGATSESGTAADFKVVRQYKPDTKKQENIDHHTHQQVFFGPDIPKGVALSVIAELKRINDPKYNKELGLAEKGMLQKLMHTDKDAKPVDAEMAHTLLKTLFRPEAKLPKTFFLPREDGQTP